MKLPPGAERRRLYRHWVRDPVVGARLFALHHLMRVLPIQAVSALGGRLGRFAGPRLHAKADARARAALRALRPDLAGEAALAATVGAMWDSLGRVYAEFSAEERVWPQGRVAVEGGEHLLAAGRDNRPTIVAGLHLGNWELIPITLGYLGHRVTDVYQPQRNRFEDRIAEHTRMRAARAVADATGTAVDGIFRLLAPSPAVGTELVRALQAGWTLMMYVDEFVGGRVHAPALGRPLRTDGNLGRVARLARLTGAAIVPAYVVRHDDVRFTVRFLPPLTVPDTGDKAAVLRQAATALDAAITGPVLQHIEQWFMLPDLRLDR